MTTYEKLIQSVTVKYNDQIKKSCESLFHRYNLNHFWYSKFNSKGDYALLGSHAEWCEFFAAEKYYLAYPHIRNPHQLENSINLLIEDEDPFGIILGSCKNRFNLNTCVSLIHKNGDEVEEFGFASSSTSSKQISVLLNEIPTFRLFVEAFKKKNQTIFSELEDNRLNIADLIGPSFYGKGDQGKPSSRSKQDFLKSLGINVPDLSDREIQVTQLLLEGYPASKIAPQIFLSRRTVEHHIERVKAKLQCISKTELIQKARHLEKLNFFDG